MFFYYFVLLKFDIMNVRIYFKFFGVYNQFSPEEKKSFFPEVVNLISVELCEPKCPFCGRRLNHASCHCAQFQKKLKSLCQTFHLNGAMLEVAGINSRFGIELKKLESKIETKAYHAEDLPATLFDFGTKFSPVFEKGACYLVSLGKIDHNGLSFYVRQEGDDAIYKHIIREIPFKPCLPQICFYKHETKFQPNRFSSKHKLGGYQIEHQKVLKKRFAYEEFLDSLIKA